MKYSALLLILALAGCVTPETRAALEDNATTIDRLKRQQELLEDQLLRSADSGTQVPASVRQQLESLTRQLKAERDNRTGLRDKASQERSESTERISGTFGKIVEAITPIAGVFGGPMVVTLLSMLGAGLQSKQRSKQDAVT